MTDAFTNAGTLNRLINQYQASPRLIALFQALIDNPSAELVGALRSLSDRLSIDRSQGVQLNRIGDIVGQPRPVGMSDSDYRVLLLAAVYRNNIGASVPELEMYGAMVLGSNIFVAWDIGVVFVGFTRVLTSVEQQIVIDTLRAAAGVRIELIFDPLAVIYNNQDLLLADGQNLISSDNKNLQAQAPV